ncbi:MAG: hypothetical protein GTN81_14905 [Proteobacteria bacterium]|nr:hypothetical protein [Pseudomonadota bacterium]
MRRVAVVGAGQGKFGVRSDASLRELAFESVKACLNDAKVTLDDVDSMVTSIAGDEFSFSLQPSAQVHDYIGFHPKPNWPPRGRGWAKDHGVDTQRGSRGSPGRRASGCRAS